MFRLNALRTATAVAFAGTVFAATAAGAQQAASPQAQQTPEVPQGAQYQELPRGEPMPQTRADWMSAVWTSIAHYRNALPQTSAQSGRFEVQVLISIRRDGTITGSRLQKSSGQEALDRNAIQVVHRISPLPPLPPDMDEWENMTLPVIYDLGPVKPQWRGKMNRRAQAQL